MDIDLSMRGRPGNCGEPPLAQQASFPEADDRHDDRRQPAHGEQVDSVGDRDQEQQGRDARHMGCRHYAIDCLLIDGAAKQIDRRAD